MTTIPSNIQGGESVNYTAVAEYNGMSIDTPLYAGMELKLPI